MRFKKIPITKVSNQRKDLFMTEQVTEQVDTQATPIRAHSCSVDYLTKELVEYILNEYEPMIKAHNTDDTKRVLPQHIMDKIDTIEMVTHVTLTGKVQRTVVINMINGFGVTGEPSVSVSAENDRKAIGTRIALQNAVNKIWPLEGYLKCHMMYVTNQVKTFCDAYREEQDK